MRLRVTVFLMCAWFASILQAQFCVPINVGAPYKPATYKPFSPSTESGIQDFFDAQKAKGIFSGNFLFYKNDSMVRGSRGYANFSRRDSFNPNDIFQLASVSKTFTGTSVMILVQEGKISLDDSVHWYLQDLKRTNLTIKNLLSHTSGLPDYFYFQQKYWPYAYRRMSNRDVVAQVNAQSWKSFSAPGRYYHYSNTNYAFLALIVEKISGMDFRHFVKIRIMEPAGMVYSHVCNFDSIPLNKYCVQGYERWGIYDDLPLNGTTGDKGVYSSTYEMFLYCQALRGEDIVHESTKEQMWSPITLANSARGMYYGLGWRVIWHNGHKWVYHNGWWKGFRTYFWRCVEEDMCFVALTNNVQGSFLSTEEMVNLIDPVIY
jgi:CubicO group peptidase (beta-lactamase class C family)